MAKNDDSGLGCLVLIAIGLIIWGISGIRGCVNDNKRDREEKAMYENTISLNTDSAYIAFLKKYRYGKYFEKVDSAFWERTLNTENYTLYIENLSDGSRSFGQYISAAKDSLDEFLWREALKSSDYQNYLEKSARREYDSYSSSWITKEGKYATAAKDSIEQIENRKWKTDNMAWEEATRLNNSFAYKKYLTLFPNGRKVQQAKKLAIDREVDEIFGSDHGKLPAMDKTSQGYGKTSRVSVYNNTSYTLTLRYSGVESKSVHIPSRTRQNLTLMNGNYRIAASVNAANVRNYAGTENLTGGSYDVEYYISTTSVPSYRPQYVPRRR